MQATARGGTMNVASILMTASAAIVLLLGSVHLLYTFRGTKLHPRDMALMAQMREVSPMLTRQTTMWKAWVGFNASHSYGAMLFGLVYGYLALLHPAFLFQSIFLLALGLVLLAAYAVLAKQYWFKIPYRGVLAAMLSYIAALLALVA
jgi:hypothetical protein